MREITYWRLIHVLNLDSNKISRHAYEATIIGRHSCLIESKFNIAFLLKESAREEKFRKKNAATKLIATNCTACGSELACTRRYSLLSFDTPGNCVMAKDRKTP